MKKKFCDAINLDIKLLKKYFNKTNFFVFLITFVISYLSSVYIINNCISSNCIFNFNIWLTMIFFIFYSIIFGNFLFPLKKYYNFLYKKRFLIAFLLFTFLVLGRFNMSSYGMWNYYIQPSYNVQSLNPIFGTSRPIRSDEWFASTAYVYSQEKNDYGYINKFMENGICDVVVAAGGLVKNILLITKPLYIGYILFGLDYGASFYWFGRLILLIIVSFEFFMIITKKNKLASVVGASLTTFAAPVFWWYSTGLITILISGQLGVIFIDMYLKSNSTLKRVGVAFLLAEAITVYGFTLYPAWMIPFAYFYVGVAIYFIIVHIKKSGFYIKEYLPLIISFIIPLCLVIYFYLKSNYAINLMSSTVYPGARFITGGSGYETLYYYFASMLYPFIDIGNPCEYSTYFSYFPVVFVVPIVILIKNWRKLKNYFIELYILILLAIFLIFTFIGFPNFLAKITFLYMAPAFRLNVVISYLCCVLFVLFIGKIKDLKIVTKIILLIFTIVIIVISYYYSKSIVPNDYLNNKFAIFTLIISALIFILYLFSYKKIINYIFTLIICFVSFYVSINVNPIMIGYSGLYEKPLSKIIESEYSDKNGTWVSLGSTYLANFLAINGLKTINTTNAFPNMDLWHIVDYNHSYEYVYNRYAHINVALSDNDSSFNLDYPDAFTVYLSHDDLCSLDVNYIASVYDISSYNSSKEKFYDLEYNDDGIWIYKNICLSNN